MCVIAIEFLANRGTKGDLAKHLDITSKTLRSWADKYPDFATALEKGKKLQGGAQIRITNKYTPGVCQKTLEYMAQGYTQKSTAALLNTTETTFQNWMKEHEDFKSAVELGKMLCHLYWEKAGMDGMNGKIKNFNATVWGLNVKNRFGFSEKTEISGDPDNPLNTNIQIEFIGDNGDSDEDTDT